MSATAAAPSTAPTSAAQTSSTALATVAALVLALALLPACFPAGPEDDPQVVYDLRILALRMEPPEVVVPLDPAAPPLEVTLTALVASPGAEAVTWTVTGCSEPGDRACEGQVPEDGAQRAALASLLRDDTGQTAVSAQGDARPEIVRPLAMEALAAVLSEGELDGLGGARPAFEITAQSGTGTEVAFKRLQVSLPDAAYRGLLEAAGIPVCAAEGGALRAVEDAAEGCLDLRTRAPNQNPTLARLEVRGPDQTEWREPDGPVPLRPGEVLQIRPSAAPGDAEAYQTLTVDVERREALVEDREELLVYSWFATRGRFALDATEETRTLGVENRWRAPTTVPEEGLDVTLWVVLRDTRGGEDFRSLTVRIEPPR